MMMGGGNNGNGMQEKRITVLSCYAFILNDKIVLN